MKTILIHGITGNNNTLFDPDARDGINDPWIYLRDRLFQLGFELKSADDNSLDGCEWVLFFEQVSINPYAGIRGYARKLKQLITGQALHRNLFDECLKAGMEEKMALFLWEPPSVISRNWDMKIHQRFPVVFTWHDNYVDGEKTIKINFPQTHKFPMVQNLPFDQRKLLTNISMNKVSHHPNELYSKRRESIRHFEQTLAEDFDLYGFGWDRPASLGEKIFPLGQNPFPSYRGHVRHKWDVLPNYRFGLCYENICEEPGFITEKIFDLMRCHCIPVYWGAPNVDQYVDPKAFVDRRQFKSDAELEFYLKNISEDEFNTYLEAIERYLKSKEFAQFLPEVFAETIIRGLRLESHP